MDEILVGFDEHLLLPKRNVCSVASSGEGHSTLSLGTFRLEILRFVSDHAVSFRRHLYLDNFSRLDDWVYVHAYQWGARDGTDRLEKVKFLVFILLI